jgi:hypothetical protein
VLIRVGAAKLLRGRSSPKELDLAYNAQKVFWLRSSLSTGLSACQEGTFFCILTLELRTCQLGGANTSHGERR